MNILFLHSAAINPIGGGISRITFVLANALKKKGYRIYYLSFKKNPQILYAENQYFFPEKNDVASDINKLFLLEFIRNYKIDILINQSAISKVYAKISYIAKQEGVQIISVIHNSILTPILNIAFIKEYDYKKKHFDFLIPFLRNNIVIHFLKLVYKIKYYRHYNLLQRNSDQVLLVSKNNIADLIYMMKNKTANNISYISNACPFDEDFRGGKKKELLWVGTPDFSMKRIDLLFQIWALLFNDFRDWSLNIVGDSIFLSEAKKLARSMKLERINFQGRIDPVEFYKNASIFCLTSVTESFSLVLVEAMHFGVIPFAFNSFPAVTDIIDDKINGFLIEPFDVNEYAKILCMVMNSEDIQRNISRKCIEKSKIFDVDKIGVEWMELFSSLKQKQT